MEWIKCGWWNTTEYWARVNYSYTQWHSRISNIILSRKNELKNIYSISPQIHFKTRIAMYFLCETTKKWWMQVDWGPTQGNLKVKVLLFLFFSYVQWWVRKCCSIILALFCFPLFFTLYTCIFKVLFCVCSGLIKNNLKDKMLKNDTFPGLKKDICPQTLAHLRPCRLKTNANLDRRVKLQSTKDGGKTGRTDTSSSKEKVRFSASMANSRSEITSLCAKRGENPK